MPASSPPPPPGGSGPRKSPEPHIYVLEAAGILIIGALMLLFILARYGHHISWSAR